LKNFEFSRGLFVILVIAIYQSFQRKAKPYFLNELNKLDYQTNNFALIILAFALIM